MHTPNASNPRGAGLLRLLEEAPAAVPLRVEAVCAVLPTLLYCHRPHVLAAAAYADLSVRSRPLRVRAHLTPHAQPAYPLRNHLLLLLHGKGLLQRFAAISRGGAIDRHPRAEGAQGAQLTLHGFQGQVHLFERGAQLVVVRPAILS